MMKTAFTSAAMFMALCLAGPESVFAQPGTGGGGGGGGSTNLTVTLIDNSIEFPPDGVDAYGKVIASVPAGYGGPLVVGVEYKVTQELYFICDSCNAMHHLVTKSKTKLVYKGRTELISVTPDHTETGAGTYISVVNVSARDVFWAGGTGPWMPFAFPGFSNWTAKDRP